MKKLVKNSNEDILESRGISFYSALPHFKFNTSFYLQKNGDVDSTHTHTHTLVQTVDLYCKQEFQLLLGNFTSSSCFLHGIEADVY